MDAQQVTEVMELSQTLESFAHTPEGKAHLIVALMDWKYGGHDEHVHVQPDAPKSKRGKEIPDDPDDEPGF